MSSDQILGMYPGTVANNVDPLKEARVTLLIPQILGGAESAWAVPASPTNTVPPQGQRVWVQFSGGDVTQPVYSPLGIKAVQDEVAGITDGMPPKQPTALALSTVQYVTAEGTTLAQVTATWTAPTENQDGTTLVDLSHYVLQTSYDNANWSGGQVTSDTRVVLDGLHTGVDFFVRVQAIDNSGNASLWSSTDITTASSTTPPPVPSTPTVLGVLGGLRVSWDGLDSTGSPMPVIFSHVQVQRDTNAAFPNPVIVGTLPGPDFLYDSVQNYANAYNYRLVAYSKVGIASAPSGSHSDTPKQAGTGDLATNSVTTNQIAAGSITAELLDANAINGKTITGVTVNGGQINGGTVLVGTAPNVQVKLSSSAGAAGALSFPSNATTESLPSKVVAGIINAGTTTESLALQVQGPTVNTANGSLRMQLNSQPKDGSNPASVQFVENETNELLVDIRNGQVTSHKNVEVLGVIGTTYYISATGVSWEVPSYNTNWSGSTTFNGSTNWGTLRYRIDAEDNLWLLGAFKAGSTAPGLTVFNIAETNWHPATQQPVLVQQRTSAGAITMAFAQISAAGNLNIITATGLSVAAGTEYLINAKVPIGNII